MSENPQIQVTDAFGVHMRWPDEGAPASMGICTERCPECDGAGQVERYIPPVCVGEPQPGEWAWETCGFCDGKRYVEQWEARQWRRDHAAPADTKPRSLFR